MSRKGKCWIVVATVMVFLILGLLLCRIVRYGKVVELLKNATEQDQAVTSLHIHSADWDTEIAFSWQTILEKRYYTVTAGTELLYLHNGAVYFSNGKGYDLKGLLDEVDLQVDQVWKALFLADVKSSVTDDGKLWQIGFPEKALPLLGDYARHLGSLQISMREVSGELKAVSVVHERFLLDMEAKDDAPMPIPPELLMEIGTATVADIRMLEPLALACKDLIESDGFRGDAMIQANCGPLSVSDTGAFYLSGDGLFFERGGRKRNLMPESLDQRTLVPGACWLLLREGNWTPEESGNGTLSVMISGETLQNGVLSVLPELEGLDFTLESGTLMIQISENQFSEMSLSCAGELPFFITQIPISIQINLSVTE